VQVPEDAEFDGMPRAAIETQHGRSGAAGGRDATKLLELWRNSQKITLPSANDPEIRKHSRPPLSVMPPIAEQRLQDILLHLRTRTGHDFKHYKRATVLRRIERRMQVTTQSDLAAYYEYLQNTLKKPSRCWATC
jgi:two-component system CheB/CheR fusion protein